jgi:hypothetical protein
MSQAKDPKPPRKPVLPGQPDAPRRPNRPIEPPGDDKAHSVETPPEETERDPDPRSRDTL